MKKVLIVCLLMVISFSSLANSQGLQNSIKDISSRLATINQQIIENYQKQPNESSAALSLIIPYKMDPIKIDQEYLSNKKFDQKEISKDKDIYEKTIKMMYDLMKEYQNNPYIRITGFDVNIALIPSVTVSFEFK